ncbi:hypothetical protein [Hafnia paralvei]|uniref:hypothetical protein n=1 Tax=Hafnia paralvei TaxID=546367 RepID=UPI00241E4DD0|nr:hypothetical protein [Hafnia paralvei]
MNYKDFITSAIEAAKAARGNKAEILEVIDNLDKSIQNVSEGRISLSITSGSSMMKAMTATAILASTVLGTPSLTQNEQYLTLFSTKKDVKSKRDIAQWSLGEDGYPVRLSYDKRDVYCKDKASLEQALAELMGATATGEKMLELLDGAV